MEELYVLFLIQILYYFDNRSTTASLESFNAKIKAFRATQRGVRDIPLSFLDLVYVLI